MSDLYKGKPGIVDINDLINNIPTKLKDKAQWVLYGYDKIPLTMSGSMARVNTPDTWCAFDEAIEALKKRPEAIGIGFVFTQDDDLVFVDFDNKEGKEQTPEQLQQMNDFLASLTDAYIEHSLSGRGVHAIVSAPALCQAGASGGKTRNTEIYPHQRYAAFTGQIMKPVTLTGNGDDSEAVYLLAVQTGIARAANQERTANNPDIQQSDDSIAAVIESLVHHNYGSDYDRWFKMAAALRHEGETQRGDANYFMPLFIEASRRMGGFVSDNDCVRQWLAIKNRGATNTTMGSLNHIARELDQELARQNAERMEAANIERHRLEREQTMTTYEPDDDAPKREALPKLLRESLPGVLFEMTAHFQGTNLFDNEEAAKYHSLMHLTHFAAPFFVLNGPLRPMFLNTYGIALQPSGSGKEHFAFVLDQYLTALGESAVFLQPYPLPSSAQAIHATIAPDPDAPSISRANRTIIKDEVAAFFGMAFGTKNNPGNSTLVTYLNELFSAGRPGGRALGTDSIAARATKRYTDPIKEPCVNLAFLGQPEAFRRVIKSEAFIGGFMGRFNTFVQTEPSRRMPYIERDLGKPVIAPLRVTTFLQRMFAEAGGKRLVLNLEPEFAEAWHLHQIMTVDREAKRYGAQWGSNRLSERSLKLAGILSVSRGSRTVLFDDYLDAYELLSHWHERFVEFLGGKQIDVDGGTAGVDDAIIKALTRAQDKRRAKFVTIGVLRQICRAFGRLTPVEQEWVLTTMVKNKFITRDGSKIAMIGDGSGIYER